MLVKDFFEVGVVINLIRRPDRKEHMRSEMKRLKFEPYYFPAYDANELKTKPGKPPFPNWTTISMGNYGNVLSQRGVIAIELQQQAESMLILEDDCQFKDVDSVENYLDNVPRNWDMIYFGGNHVEPLIPIDDKIGRCQFTLTAHAVGIRKSVFRHILEFTKDANMPIDLYYAYLQKHYNVYCPLVGLATQINGYSDIDNKEVDYSTIIK